MQSDGKILVAGSSGGDFVLARYTPDGTPDATFGTAGLVTTDFYGGADSGQSVAIQSDGKILVAGYSSGDFALARYLNPDPILLIPTVAEATRGDLFSVHVYLGSDDDPVVDIQGVGFQLYYDAERLSLQEISSGPLFGPDSSDNLILFDQIDDAAGIGSFSVGRKGRSGPVSGWGRVATFQFVVRDGATSGTATFTLSDVLAIDPAGRSVALEAFEGQVEIHVLAVWPGDTDDDGNVTATDLLPVGLHFGLTGPPRQDADLDWRLQPAEPWAVEAATYADATGDGRVSQNDALAVALHDNKITGVGKAGTGAAPLAELLIAPKPEGSEVVVELAMAAATGGLLGVAATLSLPPELALREALPAAWLDDGDLLRLQQVDAATGRAGVAFARKGTEQPPLAEGAAMTLTLEVVEAMERPVTVGLEEAAYSTSGGIVRGASVPVELRTDEVAAGAQSAEELPAQFALQGAYPNPFNPATTVVFDLPQAAAVTLVVYNTLGQEVRRQHAGEQAAGRSRTLRFEAEELPSGLYLYRLEAEIDGGLDSRTGRFVLLR